MGPHAEEPPRALARGMVARCWLVAVSLLGCTPASPSGEARAVDDRAGELPDTYSAGDPVGVIGALATPLPHVFSKVRDLLVWSDTTVLVIDGDANEIRQFKVTGEYHDKLGRAGDGPGEFRAAWALVPVNEATLAVLDRFLRMAVFTANADGALVYSRTIAMPLSASGVCAWGDHFLAYGLQSAGILHELDSAGTMLRSFGEAFGEGSPLRMEQMSNGSLVCDTRTGRVFAVSYSQGQVRSYHVESGQLEWEATLERFTPIIITDRDDGSVMNQSPPDGSDIVAGGWVEADGDLLLQVIWRPHPSRSGEERRPVRTFRLEGKSGQILETSSSIGQVEAVGPGVLVFRDQGVDYPRFEVARIRPTAGVAP